MAREETLWKDEVGRSSWEVKDAPPITEPPSSSSESEEGDEQDEIETVLPLTPRPPAVAAAATSPPPPSSFLAWLTGSASELLLISINKRK